MKSRDIADCIASQRSRAARDGRGRRASIRFGSIRFGERTTTTRAWARWRDCGCGRGCGCGCGCAVRSRARESRKECVGHATHARDGAFATARDGAFKARGAVGWIIAREHPRDDRRVFARSGPRRCVVCVNI